MKAATRVVLDTNVVLSALIFAQGRLTPLRAAWQQRRFRPLVSRATLTELLRALSYPNFKLTAEEQQELLADYLPYCTTVKLPLKTPRGLPSCRDAADLPFLQLAAVGRADYLVSGDRDLLSLAATFDRTILSPGQFLALLARP